MWEYADGTFCAGLLADSKGTRPASEYGGYMTEHTCAGMQDIRRGGVRGVRGELHV